MAAPDQARFYFPHPNPQTIAELQRNLEHVHERFDRGPWFPPYHYSGVGNGATVNAQGSYVAISPAPTVNAPSANGMIFYKEEPWTAVKWQLSIQAYQTSAAGNYSAFFNVFFNGSQFGSSGIGYTFNATDPTSVHRQISGSNLIQSGHNTQMPAGKYTLTLAWANENGTLGFNLDDYFTLDVTECLPTVAFT